MDPIQQLLEEQRLEAKVNNAYSKQKNDINTYVEINPYIKTQNYESDTQQYKVVKKDDTHNLKVGDILHKVSLNPFVVYNPKSNTNIKVDPSILIAVF